MNRESSQVPGPPDPPTRSTWGVGGAGPGQPAEQYRAAMRRRDEYDKWLTRRVGYVQGCIISAGYEPGIEHEMPLEAQTVIRDALAEFERRWPQP